MSPACFSAIIVVLCLTINFTTGVDWNERYNVDPRRSALVWTTGQNISLVVCPPENQGTTAAPGARSARADYNVPVDVFVPDSDKDVEAVRDLRRREERVKAVLESAMGDSRIVSQDKARLLGELMGEVVTKCIRDAGATSATRNITLPPSFINGLVLPLGGAVARIFLERPPPAENIATWISTWAVIHSSRLIRCRIIQSHG
ncbi:hypothetical protein RvY_02631-3 [Ramazzottius varieornatus]|uniref:Uncharacterized protein n=1 Tax=Ramazzottius varieornatus TaxID=947166 RepID=A0A1D1UKD9_RAMVA|nr:hypothetical protein RvY_02631-3 [Ramazzottius varieornatus]